jgi:hypothetical protein
MSTPSKSMAHATLIETRLKTAPTITEIPTPLDITGVGVVVYKQKSIQSEIDVAMKKVVGCAIVISWEGFTTTDRNARTPRLAHRYNICVWSKPIIDQGAYPADEVMESIINRMWQWVPDGGHAHGEAEVRDGGIVPDQRFLKIDCEVVIPVSH